MLMWPPAHRRWRQPAKPTHKAITIDYPNLVKHDVAGPTAEAARNPKFPMRTGRVFIAVTPFNVITQIRRVDGVSRRGPLAWHSP